MVSNLGKRTCEGGVALRQMKVKKDHLKALAREATEERLIQQIEVKCLKKLLEDTQGSLVSMEDRVSQLTDEILVASINYLEEEKSWVTLLYTHLDLSPYTLSNGY